MASNKSDKQCFSKCVPPCPRFITGRDIQRRYSAEAQRRLRLWGLQMDLEEGLQKGMALSVPLPSRASACSQGLEARSAVSSLWSESMLLCFSSSEEVDVESIDQEEAGDSSSQSIQYKEMYEVVTRVVANLKIDWLG